MLAAMIEAEVNVFMERFQAEKTVIGVQRVAQNRRLPTLKFRSALGDIEVSMMRIRNLAGRSDRVYLAAAGAFYLRLNQVLLTFRLNRKSFAHFERK